MEENGICTSLNLRQFNQGPISQKEQVFLSRDVLTRDQLEQFNIIPDSEI